MGIGGRSAVASQGGLGVRIKGKRPLWLASVAGLAAVALSLAGCGSQSTQASGKAPTTVTLVGGIQTEPTWWLPVVPVSFNSTSNDSTGLLWHPLLWIGTHGINFSRSIVDKITISHNDTVYTETFNPKWHWSNGTPVTAYDAAFSWQITAATGLSNAPWTNAAAGSNSYDIIKSMVATSPTTLVVTIKKPANPLWIELNALNYAEPMPKSVWDKYPNNMHQELTWMYSMGDKPTAPEFKVVDGPYMAKNFVQDQYWTLVANPNYSGHKPAIKTLVYEYETSSDSVFAALRKGFFAETDLPAAYTKSANELKDYRSTNAGYVYAWNLIEPNMSPQTPVIGNLFTKLYFRQAMQMGINEPAIVKAFYGGYATPNYIPLPKLPTNKFYDYKIPVYYPYNPTAGMKLLEKHGWHEVNGVMERNGVKLQFQFLAMSGSHTDLNIEQYLVASWAKEGIDVSLKTEPFTQLIDVVTNPKDANQWTLAWWGAGWFTGTGFPFLSAYTCNSAYNFSGYCSQTLDKLVSEAYAPGSISNTYKIIDQYEQYTAQNLPVLLLPEYVGANGSPAPLRVVQPWLHGVTKWHEPVTGGSEPWRWTTTPEV
jgi:peptide/nickel transport system substrate-binding protein